MSVGFSTVFILVIHVLRNQPIFLKSFGVHTLLTMYALCLCRMIFVIELPFTVPVELRGCVQPGICPDAKRSDIH